MLHGSPVKASEVQPWVQITQEWVLKNHSFFLKAIEFWMGNESRQKVLLRELVLQSVMQNMQMHFSGRGNPVCDYFFPLSDVP